MSCGWETHKSLNMINSGTVLSTDNLSKPSAVSRQLRLTRHECLLFNAYPFHDFFHNLLTAKSHFPFSSLKITVLTHASSSDSRGGDCPRSCVISQTVTTTFLSTTLSWQPWPCEQVSVWLPFINTCRVWSLVYIETLPVCLRVRVHACIYVCACVCMRTCSTCVYVHLCHHAYITTRTP